MRELVKLWKSARLEKKQVDLLDALKEMNIAEADGNSTSALIRMSIEHLAKEHGIPVPA